MPIIYIVRHGEARARFGEHHNPGLSQLGGLQAEATAQKLKPLGPMPIYTSPLARTRETAQFLADCWDLTPVVEHAFAEIPSPLDGLASRERWLNGIMAGTWKQLPGGIKKMAKQYDRKSAVNVPELRCFLALFGNQHPCLCCNGMRQGGYLSTRQRLNY